jgi:hypothetical protein
MKYLANPAIMMALFVSALTLTNQVKADEGHAHKTETHKAEAHEAKPITVQGEIVDLGCYVAHNGEGAEHKSCAQKCINGGMPMGVLTAEGTVYLLTLNHDNADPYNQAKTLAAEMVEITGPVHERSGVKIIDVTSVKVVKPSAAPSKSK